MEFVSSAHQTLLYLRKNDILLCSISVDGNEGNGCLKRIREQLPEINTNCLTAETYALGQVFVCGGGQIPQVALLMGE